MLVKELKKILESVPDDYKIGYNTISSICDNWSGTHTETYFSEVGENVNMNFNRKQLSLFNLHR